MYLRSVLSDLAAKPVTKRMALHAYYQEAPNRGGRFEQTCTSQTFTFMLTTLAPLLAAVLVVNTFLFGVSRLRQELLKSSGQSRADQF